MAADLKGCDLARKSQQGLVAEYARAAAPGVAAITFTRDRSMPAFKIAIIGPESVGFAKKRCRDILKLPKFEGIGIALTDIKAHDPDMVAQIIRRIVNMPGLRAIVTADRRSPPRAGRRAAYDLLRADRRPQGVRRKCPYPAEIRGGSIGQRHDLRGQHSVWPARHGGDAGVFTRTSARSPTCQSSVNAQRMSVRAVLTGDVELVKRAILYDPLVGAICTLEEVWQMVDEMPVAQAQ